jgi:RimJ/RimL family protein N-acetyltransferase
MLRVIFLYIGGLMLETKRLSIRMLKHSDLDAIHHYAKKPHIGPLAGWEPHQSLEETKMILTWMMKQQDVFAITIKGDDRLIGTIGLHTRDHYKETDPVREIGYVLDDDYWGLGIMTEAVSAIITYGFYTLNLEELIVAHQIHNARSRRVIEKNHFIPTEIKMKENKVLQYYHLTRGHYERYLSI